METAIYKRSGKKVKAWLNPEEGDGWYTIEFENGASINVPKEELEFPDTKWIPEGVEFDLDVSFMKCVVKIQEIRKKHIADYENPKYLSEIDSIGQKIKDEGLISKCKNKEWACSLMNFNDVPEKYWKK